MTIRDYLESNDLGYLNNDSTIIGKIAKRICKEKGISAVKTQTNRGRVGVYPVQILEQSVNERIEFHQLESLGKQRCSRCRKIKNHKRFYKSKCRRRPGHELQTVCVRCYKSRVKANNARPEVKARFEEYVRCYHLERKYGITRTIYLEMLDGQNGRCAICKRSHEERPLCVDHDHNTGDVRGLICRQCNTAIGLLDDKLELLEAAKTYLMRT